VEIVLVRHALPVRVDGGDGDGPADPGLAPRGREQAARLVAALAGDEITAVYSSPAARAVETAAPLAAARDLTPVVLPGLAEFDRAHTTYVPVEELKAEGGPAWELLKSGDLAAMGVDVDEFASTAVAAVEECIAAHPSGRAVLVCHAGVINVVTAVVAGLTPQIWNAPDYASVTRIAAARSGRRGLVSLNETAHVRDLLAR
jgi:broad specificity phosphatase PhoE